jgi:SAM-dependent methyltransferase
VKAEFPAAHLRCPVCRHEHTLSLEAEQSDVREVREGELHCAACGARQTVHRGVGELMVDAPEHVAREADGWTPDRIRALPDIQDGYWYVQGESIRQLFESVAITPGQWVLDLGSNTCWATNYFAVRGLNAIALDISRWEMQGLWTADYFIEDEISYFERVLGSMNDMPIASESLDYVYACEVLHHNDSAGLRRTFEEAWRVLKPGGRMLIINETLKTVQDPSGVHVDAVEQFDGYEHAHWAAQYRWEATRAGFTTRVLQPSYHPFFRARPTGERPPLRDWKAWGYDEAQRTELGRRAYHIWLNHVRGGVSFSMIATKPVAAAPAGALRGLGGAADRLRGLRRRAARRD